MKNCKCPFATGLTRSCDENRHKECGVITSDTNVVCHCICHPWSKDQESMKTYECKFCRRSYAECKCDYPIPYHFDSVYELTGKPNLNGL